VTPLANGAIDETLQQFTPLSDNCLLQLVDCLESSSIQQMEEIIRLIPRSFAGEFWSSVNRAGLAVARMSDGSEFHTDLD